MARKPTPIVCLPRGQWEYLNVFCYCHTNFNVCVVNLQFNSTFLILLSFTAFVYTHIILGNSMIIIIFDIPLSLLLDAFAMFWLARIKAVTWQLINLFDTTNKSPIQHASFVPKKSCSLLSSIHYWYKSENLMPIAMLMYIYGEHIWTTFRS